MHCEDEISGSTTLNEGASRKLDCVCTGGLFLSKTGDRCTTETTEDEEKVERVFTPITVVLDVSFDAVEIR